MKKAIGTLTVLMFFSVAQAEDAMKWQDIIKPVDDSGFAESSVVSTVTYLSGDEASTGNLVAVSDGTGTWSPSNVTDSQSAYVDAASVANAIEATDDVYSIEIENLDEGWLITGVNENGEITVSKFAPHEKLNGGEKMSTIKIIFWIACLFGIIPSLLTLCSWIWQLSWAWIDDSDVDSYNKFLRWSGRKIGASPDDESFTWLLCSCCLFAVPFIGYGVYKFYPVAIAIGLLVIIAYVGRFARRLSKKYHLHAADKNAHDLN